MKEFQISKKYGIKKQKVSYLKKRKLKQLLIEEVN